MFRKEKAKIDEVINNVLSLIKKKKGNFYFLILFFFKPLFINKN